MPVSKAKDDEGIMNKGERRQTAKKQWGHGDAT